MQRLRAHRVIDARQQRQPGAGGHGQQPQLAVKFPGGRLGRRLVARLQRHAGRRRRLSRRGDALLQGAGLGPALVGGRQQHLAVDLLDVVAAQNLDVGLLVGVDLVVIELEGSLLVVADLRRRVGRHDDDKVHLALPQPPVGLVRVGDDALRVDLRAEARGVVLHHRSHGAFVGHDEQRPQRPDLLPIADAEQQQDQERPQNQRRHQPRLAQDVENLLANEGEDANEVLNDVTHYLLPPVVPFPVPTASRRPRQRAGYTPPPRSRSHLVRPSSS